jgi:hypothetical protein
MSDVKSLFFSALKNKKLFLSPACTRYDVDQLPDEDLSPDQDVITEKLKPYFHVIKKGNFTFVQIFFLQLDRVISTDR